MTDTAPSPSPPGNTASTASAEASRCCGPIADTGRQDAVRDAILAAYAEAEAAAA